MGDKQAIRVFERGRLQAIDFLTKLSTETVNSSVALLKSGT